MPSESLVDLVNALLEQLPEQSSPVVIVVKPDRPPPAPARPNGQRANPGPQYDPALVFVLELATIVAMRDAETIVAVGKLVSDTLYNVVRNAVKVHPLVLTRAVYYLLHLLNASQVKWQSLVLQAPPPNSVRLGTLFHPGSCGVTYDIKLRTICLGKGRNSSSERISYLYEKTRPSEE